MQNLFLKKNKEALMIDIKIYLNELNKIAENLNLDIDLIITKPYWIYSKQKNNLLILEKEINLAAIIINSPETIAKTPGCLTAFYNQVSRRHVNIEDTVSCYTDTIIVVKMKDVGQAFAALTDLISEARKKFQKSRS